MKRLVVSSLAIITLFGFFTLSGNTFFGLSECEKVNQEIQTEESIGYEIWKSFDETRDYLVKQGQVSNQEYFIVNGQLVTLLESDSIIYELIDNNANCFSVKESVDNRKAMESTKTIQLSMTIFQSNFQSGNLSRSYKNEPAYDFIKNFYKEYKFTSSGKITSN